MTHKSLRLLIIAPDTPGMAVTELVGYLEASGYDYSCTLHPVAKVPRPKRSDLNGRIIWREPRVVSVLSYLADIFLVLAPGLNNLPGRYDYAICLSPHFALAGLILRSLGKVRKVVYWALDFYPRRYGRGSRVGGSRLGDLVEPIYRALERTVVGKSDVLWTVTDVMEKEWRRASYVWQSPRRRVPNTIAQRHFPRPFSERKKPMIWSGTARVGEGLELLVDNWDWLRANVADPRLTITSRTVFPPKFQSFLSLPEVDFKGFLPTLQEVRELTSRHLVSLATYRPGYKKCSDASRIKMSLSVGVPIIAAGIDELGRELESWGAGVSIGYEKEQLASALEHFRDRETNERAGWAAYALAGEYLADEVFSREVGFLEDSSG